MDLPKYMSMQLNNKFRIEKYKQYRVKDIPDGCEFRLTDHYYSAFVPECTIGMKCHDQNGNNGYICKHFKGFYCGDFAGVFCSQKDDNRKNLQFEIEFE